MPSEYMIRPQKGVAIFRFGELPRYRDLLVILTQRDLFRAYKQSILGPLWFFIQPLFTAIVFTVIFGQVAKLSTDGTPKFLFYLCGNMCWSLFSTSFSGISGTFINNQQIFGKIYFPRIIAPISNIIVNSTRFLVQFMIFIICFVYYYYVGAIEIHVSFLSVVAIVGAIFCIIVQAAGFGFIMAAATTKYRDLKYAQGFLIQLWMFATPVIYPLSMIPAGSRFWAAFNPLTPVFEIFRWAVLGTGTISLWHCVASGLATLFVVLVGAAMFARVEKNFIDIV